MGGIYEVDKTSGGSVTRTVSYYPVAGARPTPSVLRDISPKSATESRNNYAKSHCVFGENPSQVATESR
ncbi:MAG: hypothetical protein ABIU06_16975 [Anaerolineales bacterium]